MSLVGNVVIWYYQWCWCFVYLIMPGVLKLKICTVMVNWNPKRFSSLQIIMW